MMRDGRIEPKASTIHADKGFPVNRYRRNRRLELNVAAWILLHIPWLRCGAEELSFWIGMRTTYRVVFAQIRNEAIAT